MRKWIKCLACWARIFADIVIFFLFFPENRIWASAIQNLQNGMRVQRRLRSAWASAQSDQSSLCAQWVAKDPNFLHVDSEDYDQTGRMPRLIWVFAGRTCHFVAFVMRWLIWYFIWRRPIAIHIQTIFPGENNHIISLSCWIHHKNFRRRHFEIYFLQMYFSQKMGLGISYR